MVLCIQINCNDGDKAMLTVRVNITGQMVTVAQSAGRTENGLKVKHSIQIHGIADKLFDAFYSSDLSVSVRRRVCIQVFAVFLIRTTYTCIILFIVSFFYE